MIIRLKSRIAFLLPFLLIFSACTENKSNEDGQQTSIETAETDAPNTTMMLDGLDVPPGFIGFGDDEAGFAIAYPANWEMERGDQNTILVVKSPPSYDSDTFQENINVATQDLKRSGLYSLDEYVKFNETQLGLQIKEFKLLESERIEWTGQEAHEFVFRGIQSGGRLVQWRQRIVIKNNQSYVVTLTTLQESYNEYTTLSEMIFNTFTLEE